MNGPVEPGVKTGPEEGVAQPKTGASSHPASGRAALQPSEHSPWPAVLAVGLLLVAVGLLSHWLIAALGAVVLLAAIVGWLWQPWVS